MGIAVLNYLDDLAGVERREHAEFAYLTLGKVLKNAGIEEAEKKSSPPSEIMSFLGVLFNTLSMTMEITPERLNEIKKLIALWLNKNMATLKDIQSLLGKLNFVGACVKPSRIFINRLLNWLRQLHGTNNSALHVIPEEVKKDLLWWNEFLPIYNGVSLMNLGPWSDPDEIFSSDACLDGIGGFWNGHYFHSILPSKIIDQRLHIGALEMLALMVCLHIWGKNFRRRRIVVLCDNLSACIAINTGKSKCHFTQSCLREVIFVMAVNEFELRAQHITSSQNRLSDHLSRWHKEERHRIEFEKLNANLRLEEYQVKESEFEFQKLW
ncbi:uncharacterized protein LOC128551431 [Mercenaria mercenaria]|uniref:uncharacterized protein LOC128551431 n=1 Tax=Mercenaria mercenaria TaxID=6596 RepID=UPI00234E895D|nr:uncharacterized protein LOC128551431 [Mercenaria mercenaria]